MDASSIAVLGAAGSQARGMIRALGRAGDLAGLLAIDLRWDPEVESEYAALGIETVTADVLGADRSLLDARAGDIGLLVNMAGPFYVLGTAPLERAMEIGADYLDICDDVDATEDALALSDRVEAAGIHALLGMGSSPGTTNILIRAALDALGDPAAAEVRLAWIVDVGDMTRAALIHAIHCLATAVPGSQGVPPWDELDPKMVDFPDPVGRQLVILHGHPEPLTIPRFLGVPRVTNHGGLAPEEVLRPYWEFAREADAVHGHAMPEDIFSKFQRIQREIVGEGQRFGSGMQIDVTIDGDGYRFAAGSEMPMDEATGVPAAAGVLLMGERPFEGPGIYAPECLRPAHFFGKLRHVSKGGGGLQLHELGGGLPGDRVRIRDLLAV